MVNWIKLEPYIIILFIIYVWTYYNHHLPFSNYIKTKKFSREFTFLTFMVAR
jgi:hypothetical protein